MPFDSEGKFSRLHNWEDDRINDIDIVTDHHDEEDDNLADGLSQTLLRDGRVPLKGNLDAGNFLIKNLAAAISGNDAVNKAQLDTAVSIMKESLIEMLNGTFNVGDIKASALQDDHENWLLCDGRELSRTEYEDLYAAIGTAFGDGNEVTTFNIPDCRGLFLRGVDNNRGLDSNRVLGSYQADATAEHHHWVANTTNQGINNDISPDKTLTGNSTGEWYGAFLRGSTEGATGGKSSGVKGVEVENVASETRVKNLAVNYFIKVRKE